MNVGLVLGIGPQYRPTVAYLSRIVTDFGYISLSLGGSFEVEYYFGG